MFSKYAIALTLLCIPLTIKSQECSHYITGAVVDAVTDESIPFANVFIEKKGKGTVSNIDGTFLLNHICGGSCDISVSCLGYKTINQTVLINADKELVFRLYASNTELDDVVVSANSLSASIRESQKLSSQYINEEANKNLATMLESLSGVSVLRSGGGISKPVVQGLYGNRLPILNNGIAQSGQQWGNDHSPEIDPLVANTISVLNGVEALEYQGRSLGSMILVVPERIRKQDAINGQAGYYFETNGLGHGLNLQLQKYSSKIGWKFNGTLKKRGDQKAADYFLTNTGIGEVNMALQLESELNNNWYLQGYLSSFNTEIGVLRGSHIGNITDLEEALERDVPFYTNDYFSYQINAPRQTVSHHLIKVNAKHFMDDNRWINFTYASQINNRKEYDVRKQGLSDTPAMSLLQFTHFFEVKYSTLLFSDWRLNSGVQFNFIDNTNNPETDILPLIPDYYSYDTGFFGTATKRINRWQIDVGARYDMQVQKIAAISFTVPREIIRYKNNFHNYKLGFDTRYTTSSTSEFMFGLNFASRNPEVNELYSNGLHQGVGGIEEGDPDLKEEQSVKSTFTFVTGNSKKLQFEAAFYYQYINNYIFLNPQDEIRLTIRGAFPVFKYEQTRANIYGVDLTAHYHLHKDLKITGQYSFLRGQDLSKNIPLINMPSNNFRTSIRYHINAFKRVEKLSFELNQQYVCEQSNLLSEQDFVAAPDAYNLIGIKMSGQKKLKQSNLIMFIKADNLFNVSYRDYMNRMRYFADDLGVNVTVGCTLEF